MRRRHEPRSLQLMPKPAAPTDRDGQAAADQDGWGTAADPGGHLGNPQEIETTVPGEADQRDLVACRQVLTRQLRHHGLLL
jgi:hypothetical protein